ncbi:MAG: hypothetical protein WCK58_01525 [Chloroflexota bacterium]
MSAPTPRSGGYRPRPTLEDRMPAPRVQRARPDAGPMRLMLGFAGLASASAFAAAMLPSVAPAPVVDQTTQTTDLTAQTAPQPEPSVLHVTKYVTLKPGQTAPPQSTVVVRPQPTPQVKVTVKKVVVATTRQSGKP